jgi:hypothetical protein
MRFCALSALRIGAVLTATATSAHADSCCAAAKAAGVYEDTDECCRLVAPVGPTALTERLNCTMNPVYACYQNPKGKVKTVSGIGTDPGACCAACIELAGCMSWTHSPWGTGSCNLYKDIGTLKQNDKDGCSSGMIGGHGRPVPPAPPAPPVTPRGDKPNILFLVVSLSWWCCYFNVWAGGLEGSQPLSAWQVESTDGRTWSPGYQNDAIKLPNFRELQEGGINFKRHYANAPVCCPSRATFWSGRHASNIPHLHPGYPNITVGGAWNNFEGLPVGYDKRLDQWLDNVTDYKTKVSGKTDWSTGGHSENVRLDAWTMYTAWPYDIPESGGWNEENGCTDHGNIRPGGQLDPETGVSVKSAHSGDWNTAVSTTAWITEASKDAAVPWFAFREWDPRV